ncbi:MAG: hypothetical protein ETSY2_07230 [Candidatus Entotheonella gemina]|uniref:Uncharacterized protein n=1 Tax=Candidatus Entotheonella gemina TaxID=1429439 RepID=W4MD48_9BACT|nr:MAG: hypothetical protein ETSY2_07230 [Candidatus Entotheonella gemina]
MQRSRLPGKWMICGVTFFIAFCGFGTNGGQQSTRMWQMAEAQTLPSSVSMTWMSVTNWFFDMNGVKIVTDGFITRVPRDNAVLPSRPMPQRSSAFLTRLGVK